MLGLGALGASALAAACGGSAPAPTQAPAKTEAKPAESKPAAEPTKPAAESKPAAEPTKPSVAPAAKPGTAKGPITLRFTTWWVPLEQGLKGASDKFKETQPHVTVETEMVTTEFVQKMEAALVAGTWGDASIAENSIQVKWMEGGHHLNLADRVRSDGINLETDWSLGGLEIWEGKVFHMPFDNDPRAIYYNKTAFKEAGVKDPWDDLKGTWTINDMVEAAKKLNKVDGGGKITRYGLQWNYTSYQEFSPIVWGLGGNYASWKDLKYTLEDPAVLKAHQMLLTWAKQDKILITKEATTDLMGGGGTVPFRAGVSTMYHRAAYEVQLMDDVIKDKFEWDAAPLPNIDEKTPGVPVTSANPNFVPAKSRYPDEAYEWLKLLSGEWFQNFAAERKLFVPSNKKAWKTYQTANTKGKHLESFIKHVYGRRHGFHFYNAGMGAAGRAINDELDLVYLDKKKLEDALRDANKKANEVVNFGSAKQPFKFIVPKEPEKDLAKWGVA
jgi:multiple sugar transport system substrate-binding protein